MIFTDPPVIRAARGAKLFEVGVDQTSSFASADANGYYAFSDGAGGKLSYTVTADRKGYLSYLSVWPVTNTLRGIVAFYLGSTIHPQRFGVGADGIALPLDQLAGINGSYIAAGTTIELRILPSTTTGDWYAAFFGWEE